MSRELEQAFTDNILFQELLNNPDTFHNENGVASRFKENQSPMRDFSKFNTVDNVSTELKNFEIQPPKATTPNNNVTVITSKKE